MKYFEDVDTGMILRVNDSRGYEILEMLKEGQWKECDKDGSYAREYWLGEGNCCLFEIEESVATERINKLVREMMSKDSSAKMTKEEIKKRLAGRALEYLMFLEDND